MSKGVRDGRLAAMDFGKRRLRHRGVLGKLDMSRDLGFNGFVDHQPDEHGYLCSNVDTV